MNHLDYQLIEKYYAIEEDLTANHPEKIYKVYTATTEDDFNPVILKEMDEKRAHIYMALSKIWNPHIANVYSVHRLENSFIMEGHTKKQLYLAVTECVSNRMQNGLDMTLTNYVKLHGLMDKMTALKLCMQLCDGLRDIHKQGYIHKDLKPDNIMVWDTSDKAEVPVLKIIDFGVADATEQFQNTTILKTHIENAGTEGYNPHDKKVTPRWDVYSIGCILNFMLTGHTPDMDLYKGSLAVRSIIEHATDDFPTRYSSVTALYKALSHEARIRLWDRIPILRSLPGYRTHSWWKSLLATSYYQLMLYLIGELIITQALFVIIMLPLCFFLPVLTVFDPFHLFSRIHFLRKLKKNTYALIIVKTIAVICYFILSVVLTTILT